MGATRLFRFLESPVDEGDFGYLFARHVRLAYEVSLAIEQLDAEELPQLRKRFRTYQALLSASADRARDMGLFDRPSGRPGGRLRTLWIALDDSTKRFNCLTDIQGALTGTIELAILAHRPYVRDTIRGTSLAQLCFPPPMRLSFAVIERLVPDWAELAAAMVSDQPDATRMLLMYAIAGLVDNASITAAMASVAPESERDERIRQAEKVLEHAMDTLCAPPAYSAAPRPFFRFKKTDQLRPLLKAIVEGDVRVLASFDGSPIVEWKAGQPSSTTLEIVLPNNQIFWNTDDVLSTVDEYNHDPLGTIRRRESMIPMSVTVMRLRDWQRELKDLRRGRKAYDAAVTGAGSALSGTLESFAESQGVPTAVLIGLGALFAIAAKFRER